MQQLEAQYNPVLLQIRYATTKCQSDKKRPYHQRFFLFHQKLQKQEILARFLVAKKHGNTKLILGIFS